MNRILSYIIGIPVSCNKPSGRLQASGTLQLQDQGGSPKLIIRSLYHSCPHLWSFSATSNIVSYSSLCLNAGVFLLKLETNLGTSSTVEL